MSYALNQAISAYRQATTTVPPTAAVTLLLDEVLNAIALAAKHTRNKEFEEAFLRTAFGAEFETYCTRTRRWI